jgi:hypothetical protein
VTRIVRHRLQVLWLMDAVQHHRPYSLSLFITSVWRDAQALVIIFKKQPFVKKYQEMLFALL